MQVIRILVLGIGMCMASTWALGCSMFKITHDGKTMVGNNEDAWRFDSKIWFEQGNDSLLGAMYVGHDTKVPQGGMNEAGLVYDAFTVYKRPLKDMSDRPGIGAYGSFDREILKHCRTVDEVEAWVKRHNTADLNGVMLLFVDPTGKYLVVEADTTMMGNDARYVLVNFCPSLTPNTDEVTIGRYIKGRKFLEGKTDTSLAFCTAMMDTMHECRKRLGDGTTYTTIYNLNDGLVYLYFYHDYSKVVAFNLKEELAKPNHELLMRDLFPPNAEYALFVNHLTPRTSIPMFLAVVGIGLALVLSGVYWAWQGFKQKWVGRQSIVWLLILGTNLALLAYLWTLIQNQAIFYFDAPFYFKGHLLLNAAAYLPIWLAVLTVGLIVFAFKNLNAPRIQKLSTAIFGINIATYVALLCLFGYWGLFGVL